VSWDSLDWKPADGGSLGAGASILPYWPMIKSAVAEAIGADALCPVSIGDLTVAAATAADVDGLEAAGSFELLNTDVRGCWAFIDPSAGNVIGGREYTAARLGALVLEGVDTTFEMLLGEGLNLAAPINPPAPGTKLLLLRIEITSNNKESVILVSAYNEEVAAELSTHVTTLQVMSHVSAPAPSQPASTAPVTVVPIPTAAPAAAPTQAPAPSRAAPEPLPANVRHAQFPELNPIQVAPGGQTIELLLGVNLQVAVEIGRTMLPIRDVLALVPGKVVELDKSAGANVDVLVNGRAIAKGEVVVVDDYFGVRITEIEDRRQRIAAAI
jgi:flagellar motor switch protein FliN